MENIRFPNVGSVGFAVDNISKNKLGMVSFSGLSYKCMATENIKKYQQIVVISKEETGVLKVKLWLRERISSGVNDLDSSVSELKTSVDTLKNNLGNLEKRLVTDKFSRREIKSKREYDVSLMQDNNAVSKSLVGGADYVLFKTLSVSGSDEKIHNKVGLIAEHSSGSMSVKVTRQKEGESEETVFEETGITIPCYGNIVSTTEVDRNAIYRTYLKNTMSDTVINRRTSVSGKTKSTRGYH